MLTIRWSTGSTIKAYKPTKKFYPCFAKASVENLVFAPDRETVFLRSDINFHEDDEIFRVLNTHSKPFSDYSVTFVSAEDWEKIPKKHVYKRKDLVDLIKQGVNVYCAGLKRFILVKDGKTTMEVFR